MFRYSSTAIYAVLLLLLPSLILPGCTGIGLNDNVPTENKRIDDMFHQMHDSIFTNPQYVLSAIDSLQNEVTDSTNYYKLEMLRADVLCNNGNSDEGLAKYAGILEYCRSNGDKELEMLYWNYYGNYVALNLGLRDSARNCYKRAYDIARNEKYKSRLANICINLADAYRYTGDPARASHYYRQALRVLDSIGSNENIFNIYTGLGQTYAEIGSYDEAERFFNLASPMLDSVMVYDKFFYHNSYGNELYYARKYDEALDQFKLAAKYAAELQHPSARCIAETNLCEVNMLKGDIEKAQAHLDKALMWLEKLPNDAVMRFYIYSLAGDIALNGNDIRTANRYFAEAGDTTLIGPREMALHYSRLQRLYAQMHNYADAYKFLWRANHYDNLINNDRTRNQIAEIELRYRQDTTIMQQRLVISEKENEVRTLEAQIFVIAFAALLIITALILYTGHRRRLRTMNEIKLRDSLYAMRLANIRNRISPHFVFNILNRELKGSNPGIENLVQLLRANLQLCDRYTVSLSEELNFVDTYITAESPALGSSFTYSKHIDPDIDTDSIIIPSMMVQIFVENAVKHGLRGYEGKKYLDIAVSNHNGFTKISIENEGNPNTRADASSNTGTGMKVVMQTINLLNERNEQKIDLNIHQHTAPDGTSAIYTVSIMIPHNFDFSGMNLDRPAKGDTTTRHTTHQHSQRF